jgi:hypothetical protein
VLIVGTENVVSCGQNGVNCRQNGVSCGLNGLNCGQNGVNYDTVYDTVLAYIL